MLRILVDLHSCEKRDIEIAGSETEGPAAVFPEYLYIRGVTELSHRAPGTGEPMIVGRYRHRPVPGNRIVVCEQSARGLGRKVRIISFIEYVIDLQEAASGTSRELPDA
jgi:hypothetical protein